MGSKDFSESPKTVEPGRLCCSTCGGGIHWHDRFVIERARHRDCADPKLVGQRSLTPVMRMLSGEPVNIAPAASMGAELIGAGTRFDEIEGDQP